MSGGQSESRLAFQYLEAKEIVTVGGGTCGRETSMQSDDPSWTELSREDEKNVRYWATKVATKSFDI